MEDETPFGGSNIIGLARDIIVAYVANNPVPAAELPALIASTHAALVGLGRPVADAVQRPDKAAIARSVRPDALISFEDGRSYKALRRHLTLRGLTAEDYRRKWGLPVDYPMVAPEYSVRRSAISKEIGLGRHGAQGERQGRAKKAT